MPPFTNGQSMYPQWGQFPATPTPGIPTLPLQGPSNPTPPNHMSAMNAGPLGQNAMNNNQSPPNQNPTGPMPPAQTGIVTVYVLLNTRYSSWNASAVWWPSGVCPISAAHWTSFPSSYASGSPVANGTAATTAAATTYSPSASCTAKPKWSAYSNTS